MYKTMQVNDLVYCINQKYIKPINKDDLAKLDKTIALYEKHDNEITDIIEHSKIDKLQKQFILSILGYCGMQEIDDVLDHYDWYIRRPESDWNINTYCEMINEFQNTTADDIIKESLKIWEACGLSKQYLIDNDIDVYDLVPDYVDIEPSFLIDLAN